MSQREYDLGTAELEVLTELWNEEPATVRQVLTRLRGRGRRLAYTTVLTFLTRLEQKGFVSSDKSGLAYVYRAAVSRERVQQSRLKSLLQELYDGAAGSLALAQAEFDAYCRGGRRDYDISTILLHRSR